MIEDSLIEVWTDVGYASHLVGHLRYIDVRRSRSSEFVYDAGWLAHPESYALDPANLPLQAGAFHTRRQHTALPGPIRDTAPDRWGQKLIDRAYRKAGHRRHLTEIDYLLGLSDSTRIGALRFKRAGDEGFGETIGSKTIPPLIELAALLRAADAIHNQDETDEDIRLLLYEGSPIGGARPKSVVRDNDGSLAIAKFPKPDDDRSIAHGEVLALKLAAETGIDAAEARLVDVGGRPVALIKRFDRAGDQRIPFVSAMSLLGLDDGDHATYTDIADLIRAHSSAPHEDLHELFRRVVFNVLAGNLDDHLRNHGFVYGGNNQWRLSKAYDLNPTPIHEKARVLETWISEAGPEADLELAREVAGQFALDPSEAEQVIDEVTATLARWSELAKRLGMSQRDVAVYATAFAV